MAQIGSRTRFSCLRLALELVPRIRRIAVGDMKSLPIGALSQQTGVKVPTIRYYEGVGLLPAPDRTESNRRTYGPDAVSRLRFIRHARELGFEVDAIRQLPALADDA